MNTLVFVKKNFDRLLCSILCGNFLFFIWGNKYQPMTDWPDWIYQGALFASLLKGTLLEAYRIVTYPVPYSATTAIIGFLSLIFQPEIAGKIYLTLYVFTFVLGLFYFFNSIPSKLNNILLYLAVIFIGNSIFFFGGMSYAIGQGLLFFCIGYVLRTFLNNRSWNPYFIFGSSVFLFFVHGFIYLSWLLFIFGLMLFLRHNRLALKNIIVGLLPSIILAGLYFLLRDPNMHEQTYPVIGLRNLVIHKMYTWAGYFSPLREFQPFLSTNPSLALPILVNTLFNAFLLLLAVLWLIHIKESISGLRGRYLVTMATILLGIFISAPSVWIVDDVGARFLYQLLFCISASFSFAVLNNNTRRSIRMFLIITSVVQAIYLNVHVAKASDNMAKIMSEVRDKIDGADFHFIDESYFKFDNGFRRKADTNGIIENFFIPRYKYLSRLMTYLNLNLGRESPIFRGALFNYTGKMRWIDGPRDIKLMEIQPTYYVILGGSEGNKAISELLLNDYRLELEKNNYIVMRRKKSL